MIQMGMVEVAVFTMVKQQMIWMSHLQPSLSAEFIVCQNIFMNFKSPFSVKVRTSVKETWLSFEQSPYEGAVWLAFELRLHIRM